MINWIIEALISAGFIKRTKPISAAKSFAGFDAMIKQAERDRDINQALENDQINEIAQKKKALAARIAQLQAICNNETAALQTIANAAKAEVEKVQIPLENAKMFMNTMLAARDDKARK